MRRPGRQAGIWVEIEKRAPKARHLTKNILKVKLDAMSIERFKEFFSKRCRAFGAHSRDGANLVQEPVRGRPARLSTAEDAATMDMLCVVRTGTITMNQLAVTGVIPLDHSTEMNKRKQRRQYNRRGNHEN